MNLTRNCVFVCTLIIATYSHAQKQTKQAHIFSAVTGTLSKPDTFRMAPGVKSVTLSDASGFTILEKRKTAMIIAFAPINNFVGIARTTLVEKNASGKTVSVIYLTGLSSKGLEGANEVPLSVIADALGYHINIGWSTLDNNALPQLMGDEIAAARFRKAAAGKVQMIPVARYSPDFPLRFGYYINASSAPEKKQVGVLATKDQYPEHQTLFPAIASGTTSFDPGKNSFGFYADGPSHTAYSEDDWNMALHPGNAVRATRIYPVKDASDKLLPHTYLVCFEEAKNGDFNDYVFLVKNIVPVAGDGFISLFNGKNLDGWNSFLRDIGPNKDPDNNFRIEDGTLHVLGKDLGYVITKKGFSNYHFKVDFKWGEARWPPRDTFKRDAGICYNIPVSSPDSIWPQSIECQIQEGDCGDFWLLGFSTITVDGKTNVPANHVRMIKKRDAENPKGEWNTMEVISYNGRCIHIVNGVVVNVGENASVKNGKILLQSEYAEVYYRNAAIKEL
ncbi:MAG: DUF1080 domain-containing protein [Flavisolibacter sp.]